MENIIAGDALALTPTSGLIGAETGTTDLLGVTRSTTEVTVDELTASGNAWHAIREGLAFAVVKIRGQRTQLVVGQQHHGKRQRE